MRVNDSARGAGRQVVLDDDRLGLPWCRFGDRSIDTSETNWSNDSTSVETGPLPVWRAAMLSASDSTGIT